MVQGNYIGTDVTGTSALGNSTNGVDVAGGLTNTIGGTVAAARNVISGNKFSGVFLHDNAAGNLVQGNYIGTNLKGTTALGNTLDGIQLENAPNNVIGGSTAGMGNVISGNRRHGISLVDEDAKGNLVQGNSIGTDVTGTAGLGNMFDGINCMNAPNNVIGGSTPGTGNVIAFNGGNGVTVGTSLSDTSVGDAIRGNAIFSNTKLGIDLGNNGVTLNTPSGPHTGPNNLQNFPVLTSAVSSLGKTTIGGTLNSTPNTTFTLEFFASPTADPTGYGEGKTFLGLTTVTTDAKGNASFSVTFAVPSGYAIAATATDPRNNTSEFSRSRVV